MKRFSDEVLERTHSCGELRAEHIGRHVGLCGWVRSYRDHGGVVFVDLRDREGITQIVFDLPADEGDAAAADLYQRGRSLRNEWVIAASGAVRSRGPDRENPKLPTGQIEVVADSLTVLSRAEPVPFEPDGFSDVAEETRLRFRFIDLRRAELTRALRLRHRVCRTMRRVLDDAGFVEIETPFLTKSTPEGARDFLVPCRFQQGTFYALPQSPQLFKQILMVGGLDRYYQIVRCFRDEDLRADRQPEFTQLDLEMSFVAEADVMDLTNRVLRAVCEEAGRPYPEPVPVMTYQEAMERYGTDRPDTRFEMHLHDCGPIVSGTELQVFSSALQGGGAVKALCVGGGAKLTRKEIDAYAAFAADYGAEGLAWTRVEAGQFVGGVAKFLTPQMQAGLREACGAGDGDLLLFSAGALAAVSKVLGALRVKLGADRKLYSPEAFEWCWVVDFPLVEWDEQAGRWESLHHPFTSPRAADVDKLESEPHRVLSRAYDIVCNGQEMGGGSIRINSLDVQRKVFGLLGIGEAEAHEKFDFLLAALRYGAPPHGGIALGLDRVVMELIGARSLRDVIAFPKTQRGTCPLTGAPAVVDASQLAELHLKAIAPPKVDQS